LEELLANAVQLFLALTLAYALALWFALVVWTYRDIVGRSSNVITHIFSTLIVVLFWVPGAIIYLILRPRETLDESFQRAMEEEYLRHDLDDFAACPSCSQVIRDEYVFCPHCSTELRHACVNCQRMIDNRWESCAYCGSAQYETVNEANQIPAVTDPDSHTRQRKIARQLQSIDGGKARDRILTEHDREVSSRSNDAIMVNDSLATSPLRSRSGHDQG